MAGRVTRRTYWLVERVGDTYAATRRIRCEVIGEMSDGSKVWEDSTGEQYFAIRADGSWYFVRA